MEMNVVSWIMLCCANLCQYSFLLFNRLEVYFSGCCSVFNKEVDFFCAVIDLSIANHIGIIAKAKPQLLQMRIRRCS